MGIWQTFLETNLGLFRSKPNMVSVHMLLKITNECASCSTFLLLSAKRSALHPSDKCIYPLSEHNQISASSSYMTSWEDAKI